MLCEVKVTLCIVDGNDRITTFSSHDLKEMSSKYIQKSVISKDYLKTENVINLFKNSITDFLKKDIKVWGEKVFWMKIESQLQTKENTLNWDSIPNHFSKF